MLTASQVRMAEAKKSEESSPKPAETRNSRVDYARWSRVDKIRSLSRQRRFVDYVVEHSLLLPAGAGIALIWANVSLATYSSVAHTLEFAVNDIGMALFFALATKEVVEATAPGGALHTWR